MTTSKPDAAGDTQQRAFLNAAGWGEAQRNPLGGDASTRRYERLRLGEDSAMLMIAPSEGVVCLPEHSEDDRNALGWNAQSRLAASRVDAFIAVDDHLRGLGLSAPKVIAADLDAGLVLLEDLGDDLFARVIEQGKDEPALYRAAAEVLAIVHSAPTKTALPVASGVWPVLDYDALALRVNADLFYEWSPQQDPAIAVNKVSRTRWEEARDALISEAETYPRALILRDYHAENLIWLPDREGPARVGLLDFQDAVLGWAEWDFAMLLQDARRVVSGEAHEAAVATYLDRTGGSREAFDARLAVLGTLNALRVAGVFARLIHRDNKPKYLDFLPRQLTLLGENLNHPAAAAMRAVIAEGAPHLLS